MKLQTERDKIATVLGEMLSNQQRSKLKHDIKTLIQKKRWWNCVMRKKHIDKTRLWLGMSYWKFLEGKDTDKY